MTKSFIPLLPTYKERNCNKEKEKPTYMEYMIKQFQLLPSYSQFTNLLSTKSKRNNDSIDNNMKLIKPFQYIQMEILNPFLKRK